MPTLGLLISRSGYVFDVKLVVLAIIIGLSAYASVVMFASLRALRSQPRPTQTPRQRRIQWIAFGVWITGIGVGFATGYLLGHRLLSGLEASAAVAIAFAVIGPLVALRAGQRREPSKSPQD